jgi:hypothetical protein
MNALTVLPAADVAILTEIGRGPDGVRFLGLSP